MGRLIWHYVFSPKTIFLLVLFIHLYQLKELHNHHQAFYVPLNGGGSHESYLSFPFRLR